MKKYSFSDAITGYLGDALTGFLSECRIAPCGALLVMFLLSGSAESQEDQKMNKYFSYVSGRGYTATSLIDITQLADWQVLDDSELVSYKSVDRVIFHKDQTEQDLQLSDSMVVYMAVESPHAQQLWLVGEWNPWKSQYVLYLLENGRKRILEKDPDWDVLKPFAWSSNPDLVYCELTNLNTLAEHQGIYELNIRTGKMRQIPISSKYISTPEISPDRTMLLFSTFSGDFFNQFEDIGDKITVFDLNKEIELVTYQDESGLVPFKWYNPAGQSEPREVRQLTFKLPWPSGICYGVYRHGSNPAPTGGNGTTCGTWPSTTAHTYAAVDFDIPNDGFQAIVPVASGTIAYVGSDSQSGIYVKITHSDGNQTFYMHFDDEYVSNGEVVDRGCVIGDGGCTGNCSGDHLHFEYRVGSQRQNAVFNEAGVQVKAGKKYQSSNAACRYDVTATNITLTDYDVYQGQSVTANFRQAIATSGGLGVTVKAEYRWSTTSTAVLNGTNLGSDNSELLDGDSYDAESLTFNVPSGVGQRYLKIGVDVLNAVQNEYNESNVWVIPVNVHSGNSMNGDVGFSVESRIISDSKADHVISIYPNPGNEIVTIIIPVESGLVDNVLLLDWTGRVIKKVQNYDMEELTLNVSNWTSGVYSVVVYSENSILSKNFLVQH